MSACTSLYGLTRTRMNKTRDETVWHRTPRPERRLVTALLTADDPSSSAITRPTGSWHCSPSTSASRSRRRGRLSTDDRRLPRPDRTRGRTTMTTLLPVGQPRGTPGVDATDHPRPDPSRSALATCWRYFERPRTSNGPSETINGRLEHPRGLKSTRDTWPAEERGPVHVLGVRNHS